MITPGGERISFSNARSSCGGVLDVDMNSKECTACTDPVENIYWPVGQAPMGKFRVQVHLYIQRSYMPVDFKVRGGGGAEGAAAPPGLNLFLHNAA